MYVDKTLSGIKAVQTLSRLNRAHSKKHDVFVLDFLNEADTIRDAFADFYRATILADETDPNKLHDLQADLDAAQIYSPEQVDDFVKRYLGGGRTRLNWTPSWTSCVPVYLDELNEDEQVAFKGKAKAIRANLCFPVFRPPVHQYRMGEALDIPELPDFEAARSQGRRPLQGHSRRHRHGKLPGRETGDTEDRAA